MPSKFSFEGELLTVSEVQQRVPALSKNCIRNYLRRGMNTKQEMLTYRCDFSAIGRKGKERAAKNFGPIGRPYAYR